EFVYPKQQALEIAKHAREPILAAEGTNLHKLSSITVESIGPIGTQAPVTESAANVTKSEPTAVFEEKPSVAEAAPPPQPSVEQEQQVEPQSQGEIAQNIESSSSVKTESEVQQQKPSEAPVTTENQPVTDENRELPRTAGELLLFALVGALC